MLTFLYVVLPVIITAAAVLRKCREYSWGKCKIKENLQGKVFIVTGANSGIGKETVKELAKHTATVILACRNLNSAKDTVSEIFNYAPEAQLIPMELDLASYSSIRHFVTEVLSNFPQIHVLINNAGVYVPLQNKAMSEDGYEIHFAVNHLGHFLLTNLLLERLKQSPSSRVVIVTSKLFESGIIDFSNLNGEKSLPTKKRMNPAYCNSKLANTYFGYELTKKISGTNPSVYMVCPGFTYTGLFRHVKRSWFHYIIFAPVALFFLRTAKQGAQTVLYCATDSSIQNETGNIYRDCKLYKSKKVLEPEVAKKLWEVSEKMTETSKID